MISLLWPSPLKARVIEDIGINEPQLLASYHLMEEKLDN